MVFLQGNFISLGNIDPDQVGVVLVPVAICYTLQEHLNKPQTPETTIKTKVILCSLIQVT